MQRKIAVVDVGSNSVRLMLLADGKVLYKRTQITRLGEGLSLTGALQPQAIERTVAQIAAFQEEGVKQGADVYAYATAAVRSANNGAQFVQDVWQRCGVRVDVLSGEEEGRVGLKGSLGDQDGGLIDVGGGSSELVIQRNRQVIYQKSLDVGVVRLKDVCGRDRKKLSAFCAERVQGYQEAKGTMDGLSLCAVGGTATTLAAIANGLTAYDGHKVTGTALKKEKIQALTDKLFSLSVEEIATIPCVDEKRAQVLTGGAVWLSTVLDYLEVDAITVSDCDNLEGYAMTRGWM